MIISSMCSVNYDTCPVGDSEFVRSQKFSLAHKCFTTSEDKALKLGSQWKGREGGTGGGGWGGGGGGEGGGCGGVGWLFARNTTLSVWWSVMDLFTLRNATVR